MQTHLASCNYLILSLNNKTQEGRKKKEKRSPQYKYARRYNSFKIMKM